MNEQENLRMFEKRWYKNRNEWLYVFAYTILFITTLWFSLLSTNSLTLTVVVTLLYVFGLGGRVLANNNVDAVSKTLEEKRMTDEHTGVMSKSRLVDALDRELKSAKRKKTPVSLIVIDALNIIEVNQRFDRIEGDALLVAMAMATQKCLRDTDYLGRVSGLVFCAILPESDAESASVVLKRMSEALKEIVRSHPKGEVKVKARLVAGVWNGAEAPNEFLNSVEKQLNSKDSITVND